MALSLFTVPITVPKALINYGFASARYYSEQQFVHLLHGQHPLLRRTIGDRRELHVSNRTYMSLVAQWTDTRAPAGQPAPSRAYGDKDRNNVDPESKIHKCESVHLLEQWW